MKCIRDICKNSNMKCIGDVCKTAGMYLVCIYVYIPCVHCIITNSSLWYVHS